MVNKAAVNDVFAKIAVCHHVAIFEITHHIGVVGIGEGRVEAIKIHDGYPVQQFLKLDKKWFVGIEVNAILCRVPFVGPPTGRTIYY